MLTGRSEVAWWKKVEGMFAGVKRPEFRQLIVEMLMVTATCLERNTELTVDVPINIDQVVRQAIEAFKHVSATLLLFSVS